MFWKVNIKLWLSFLTYTSWLQIVLNVLYLNILFQKYVLVHFRPLNFNFLGVIF
jgi:hypothetical protein